MRKQVADILFETLVDLGVKDCFSVVGGGAMHLDRAMHFTKGLDVHFNHHEQACAMGAEAYARFSGQAAAVCVTSGPGATNTLTGVMGAWQESIPMVVISGNVRYAVSIESTGLPVRYRGIQEFDIINSVQNMTKYAVVIKDPSSIRAEVRKAYSLAMSGRRGPVWIDVPLDIQNAVVDEKTLIPDYPRPFVPVVDAHLVDEALALLKASKRPVILTGSAITTSHLFQPCESFLNNLAVPIVGGAWCGDQLPRAARYYYGSSGNVGPRTGNYVLSNADLIIALGNSLSYKQTGYDVAAFAPRATVVMIDVDENERKKLGGKVDLFVQGSLESFFEYVEANPWDVCAPKDWIEYCDFLKATFSPFEGGNDAKASERVNKYLFWKLYYDKAPEDNVLVLGNSQVCLSANQVGKDRPGQRMLGNLVCGSMGYDLPAAIGVAIAAKRPVICVTGDGSFMMNLQELETIVFNHYPVKIVIFENDGYGAIKQTHQNFFDGVEIGCSPESGVGFPSFKRVAEAFGLTYHALRTNGEVEDALDWLFDAESPVLLEVSEQLIDPCIPKLVSHLNSDGSMSSPLLTDFYPPTPESDLCWVVTGATTKDPRTSV